jgi:predicted pyridoxine 5'-phosphate oxidase superfamily flavin-nucleotide-binding protein
MSTTSPSMLKKIIQILHDREFVNVATCDLECRPNAAPKFFLKLHERQVYLIDYTRGRTCQNLKVNPRASLSFVDIDSLSGYQINGSVQILERGEEYDAIAGELRQREIDLSTKRIIEGVAREKRHGNYEVALPDDFVLLKVAVKEIVEIGSSGNLKRERV